MQGILFFVVALFAVTHAQANGNGKGNGDDSDGGGCCFYSGKGFQNVVVCTSEEFNIPARANIQSFFCTEQFSAAIVNGQDIQELAGCGDVLNASLLPIPATRITVGPCSPERRCCLYTGVNKDGDEFCLNAAAASAEELRGAQANNKFRVAECTAAYRATLTVKGGRKIEVPCGVTEDIPANTEFEAVTMTPCPNRALNDDEFVTSDFVDQAFDDEEQFVDQAVSDQFVDQAVGDQFVDQAVGDQFVDQAVGDQFVDQAVGDQFVDQAVGDQFVDQAVGDQFDATFDAQYDAATVDNFAGDNFAFDNDAEFAQAFNGDEQGSEFAQAFNGDEQGSEFAQAFDDGSEFAADNTFAFDNTDAEFAQAFEGDAEFAQAFDDENNFAGDQAANDQFDAQLGQL